MMNWLPRKPSLAVLLAGALLQGCVAPGMIVGHVLDEQGHGIQGVELEWTGFDGSALRAKSGEDGCFKLVSRHGPLRGGTLRTFKAGLAELQADPPHAKRVMAALSLRKEKSVATFECLDADQMKEWKCAKERP